LDSLLFHVFVYLAAAVIAVPLAKRFGLGSVLGYLVAGIVIGPLIGLVGAETEQIKHFAEFGVVMMLFLVGLELKPRMLWEMRGRLLGLGGLQVLLTAALIAAVTLLFESEWRIAVAVGFILALSSTAIVLQTLNEKGLSGSDGGRASFSVLLFQDIAVIPLLALIPLLAVPGLAMEVSASDDHGAHMSLVEGLPGWGATLVVIGSVAFVILGGHFLTRPLFRLIAASRLREIFTAAALLIVVGIALLMTLVGLSPALGTFLAGVVLADSEFRHELESDIEPFKGLLLGLFFITVGAGIDFGILFNEFGTVIGLTLAVIGIKGAVLYALAKLFRLKWGDDWLFTLSLAQAGEFGFVLLSFSIQSRVLPTDLAATLALVVALSMLLTPMLFILYDRVISPTIGTAADEAADEIDRSGTVVIAGIGRFGQIVNRLLVANGVPTVVLDYESAQIDILRKVGIQSYFGDASRPDLLHAAGIENAALFVVAIDNREQAVQMVEHVRRHYPHVAIIARAFDVNHLYRLQKAGVDVAVREMFDGSLEVGMEVLRRLGAHPFKVEKIARAFRKHDLESLDELYGLWDENPDISNNRAFLARAKQRVETLEAALSTERSELHDRSERGWTPPPKGYTKAFEE
jgi:CPA2 family monovalent cation:H+ antiporter-2